MTAQDRRDRFTALVNEHRRIVFKVANAYARSREDREDLAQEIVVQLWRSFPSFDPERRFSTWMYRVALNVAISAYRREHVRTQRLAPEGERLLETVAVEGTPPAEVLALRALIETLKPLDRALALLYLDGNSHREIADVLGISETNAGTKIGRLKQTLRHAFGAPESA